MAVEKFPPVNMADEDGLLAFGGDLEIPSLLMAYRSGIFPWPISPRHPLAWFSPDPRGVLFYEDLHVGTSLKKVVKRGEFQISFNQAFHEVIFACALAKNRRGPGGEQSAVTWITEAMVEAYIDLHYAGHAYSVEAWKDGELAGGLYGVMVGNYACGESMFYKVDNASKVALLALMQKLKSKGIDWLDTQMVTPVVRQLGGKEIPRVDFIKRLEASLPCMPGQSIHTIFTS